MDKNKQMNPDEMRNLIVFMLASLILYFAYDNFILQPHAEALRAAKQQAALEQAAQPSQQLAAVQEEVKPLSVDEALAQRLRAPIENDFVEGSINLQGARIDNLILKDYLKTLEGQEKVSILNPAAAEFPRSVEHGWVSSNLAISVPGADTKWQLASGSAETLSPGQPVKLIWSNGQGLDFTRTLSLDEDYLLTVKQSVINRKGQSVTLFPYGLVTQKGLPLDYEDRFISHEGPIAYVGGELEAIKYKKMRKEKNASFEGQEGWIGITDKYWFINLMPPQGQQVKYRFHHVGEKPQKNQKDDARYQVDYTGAALTLAPGQSGSVTSHVFAGPKRVLMLKDYAEQLGVAKLDLAVDFGMFWFFTVPFFYGLHYLGEIIGNMGLAIIALTLIIRTAASPLTYSSYKSFAKMKKVMPEVNALRDKFGEDKEKMQKEMLALYQREGVNPAAGCFPILLQIPIFYAFYKILFITIEVRHKPFFGWIEDLSAADPTSLFNLFGLIPWDPPGFLMIGIWPCLMLVAMQIQRRLNPPPTDPIQRDMALWFPFIMTFVMAQFAAGLVIYWTVSAFFGIVQQMVIMRKMGVPIHLLGETPAEEKAADDASDKGVSKDDRFDHDDMFEGDNKPVKPIKPPKPKKKKKK